MYKVTSFDLKLALMQYFRYGKQCVVTEECNDNDIMVDTGNEIVEIEVKMSVSDMRADLKKRLGGRGKHDFYSNPRGRSWMIPNKFYFCVPSYMKDDALAFAKMINPKYGVFVFDEKKFLDKHPMKGYIKKGSHAQFLKVAKRVGKLHERYSLRFSKDIALRSASKCATMMYKKYEET